MKPEKWSKKTLVVLSLLVPQVAAAQVRLEGLDDALDAIGLVLVFAAVGVVLSLALAVSLIFRIVRFVVRRAKSKSKSPGELPNVAAEGTSELPYLQAMRLRGQGVRDEAIRAELVKNGLSEDDATLVIDAVGRGPARAVLSARS